MKRSTLWTSGLLVLALAACDDTADTSTTSSSSGSSSSSSTSTSTSSSGSTTSSSSSSGSGTGGGPQMLSVCLDRPDVLLTPPDGTLPCELIPPGVTITLP